MNTATQTNNCPESGETVATMVFHPNDYDWRKHYGFKKYYDTATKKNYWVFEDFTDSPHVLVIYRLGDQFTISTGLSINTLKFIEVNNPFKNIRCLFSEVENQLPEDNSNVVMIENLLDILTEKSVFEYRSGDYNPRMTKLTYTPVSNVANNAVINNDLVKTEEFEELMTTFLMKDKSGDLRMDTLNHMSIY